MFVSAAAAELGDCDDDDDDDENVRAVIEQPQLLPTDALPHTEEILLQYKTLRSDLSLSSYSLTGRFSFF